MQKKSAYILFALSIIPMTTLYTNCGSSFESAASNLSQSIGNQGSGSSSSDNGSGNGTGTTTTTDNDAALGAAAVASVVTSTADFKDPFVPVKTITVCPSGCDYQLPSQAFAAAVNMTLIKITAGDYNDCGTLPSSVQNIWVKGVGEMAHMYQTSGQALCQTKGIIVADSANITIDNMEFSGAAISDSDGKNGAGIRMEGQNLTIRNSDFHDNQNGILTNNDGALTAVLLIQNSHFARNGYSGTEHNMYVGHSARFTLMNSVSEQVLLGHTVKTRALTSIIACNQIMNGYDNSYNKQGYLIDMPNGGAEQILYNTLGQGPDTGQKSLIAFGAEGLGSGIKQSVTLSSNILINDLGAGTFLNLFANPTSPAALTSNMLVGGGTTSNSTSITETGDVPYASRSAASISSSGFPRPSACKSALGLMPVTN